MSKRRRSPRVRQTSIKARLIDVGYDGVKTKVPPNGYVAHRITMDNSSLFNLPIIEPDHCTSGIGPMQILDEENLGSAAMGTLAVGAGVALSSTGVGLPAGLALIGGAVGGAFIDEVIEEGRGGAKLRTRIMRDGREETSSLTCVPAGQTVKGAIHHQTPLEEGEYDYTYIVEGANSGNEIHRKGITMKVEEGRTIENGDDGNFLDWAIENPALAGAVGIGGIVAVNAVSSSATETATRRIL